MITDAFSPSYVPSKMCARSRRVGLAFGKVRSYWFQFDKRNGDLVDTNHLDGETDGGGILSCTITGR